MEENQEQIQEQEREKTKSSRNYLFVCSWGMDRSPTARDVCLQLAFERKKDIMAAYLGTRIEGDPDYIRKFLTKYDKIFVMEKEHFEAIRKYGVPYKKIVLLDVPDVFNITNSRLKTMLEDLLREKLSGWI